MSETFEQMALRVAEEVYGAPVVDYAREQFLAFAHRLRDELCKEQEPATAVVGKVGDSGGSNMLTNLLPMGTKLYTQESSITAEQAYSTQLQRTLEYIKLHRLWINSHCKAIVETALALPQDDTALKQYGAKLLRDAAGAACGIDAAMLSRMADELEGNANEILDRHRV